MKVIKTERGARPRRVLVVDDYPDTVESFCDLLRAKGYQALVAKSGLEALRKATAGPLDAILLDMDMPVIDGPEVCRRIRAEPWGKKLLIVAISGWTDEKHRLSAMRAGCDYHVVKPVGIEAICRLLESNGRAKTFP